MSFRKTSVRFITHSKTFLNMNPFNIGNSTIFSVQTHSQTESETSDDEGSIISSMSTSANDSSSSFKKKWGRIRHVVVRKLHHAKRQRISLASRKKLLNLLCTSYKNYVKLPDKTITSNASSQKDVPFSYLWLLYICSSIIEETCPMLDCHVKNIEGLYHIRKISKFRKNSIRNMEIYFKQPV